MKALVLSGGMGTRLRPFTHSMPKQLFPVANQPVLAHVLGKIRTLGVTEVGIVVGGGGAAQVEEAIGDGSRFGLQVTYVHQHQPRGLAHAVQVAADFLGTDDFLVYLGDNVLTEGLVEFVARFRDERPAAHLLVQKVSDPRSYGVVELDAGRVQRLVEKPASPRSDLAIVGVYLFTDEIHTAIREIRPGRRGELELTDAVQWLVDSGARVEATEYGGNWSDVGQVDDLLECNRHLLTRLEADVAGEVDEVSVVESGVRVEAGARVVRSVLRGPAVIGAETLVEDSIIAPNTSVGAGCVVRRTCLADSIVLDGAQVTGVPQLRGSIVGRSATVTGVAEGVHRLLVGDHSQVEIPRSRTDGWA
ncbi:glucose-1-phosphate thymidylyltransferase [Salinispora arenicola]|uniref:Glucose-1-phosphate thymidylyltransferase n=1 Tax=Salinispora arenicola TaxID=168697 RepID=A0A542XTM0_SALAC|nr:glucose-1-phosphate thymidylyltransferase [Salinispora arenicola]TQL39023.1 glucose-1-phosphate thymidylyltransferase [Salinispora arenicola]GIM86838.1 glucose-1-phosphate thymidylyltransferase [Salinispora arenicola]